MVGTVTTTISSWQEAVTLAATTYSEKLVKFLPQLLGALVILFLGKILSLWARGAVKRISKVTGIEKILDIAGLDELLDRLGFKITIADFLGLLVYWGVMLVFFVAALDILGLSGVSAALGSVLAYIPKVVAAVLILALGFVIANVIENFLTRAFKTAGVKIAKLLSLLAKSVIILFVVLAAISELGIAQDFVRLLFAGIVFALSLGMGLAFGLGTKDLVGKIVTDWYKKISK